MFSFFRKRNSKMASSKQQDTKSDASKGSDEKLKTVLIDDELKYNLIDDASRGQTGLFKKNEELLKGLPMKTLADYDDRTPLHLAAAQGHLSIVTYLVDTLGNDVFFQDRWGRNAYDEAKRSNQEEVATFLQSSMDKRRPQILYNRLLEAACKGNLDYLKTCHARKQNMSYADYDNRTPLHLAVAANHSNVVEFLIKECKVDQTIKDREGNTPLAEARRCQNKEMEESILKFNGLI